MPFDFSTAVLVTLAYSDQFRFALSFEELWLRLPTQLFPDVKLPQLTRSQLARVLMALVEQRTVLRAEYQDQTYYFLSENSHPAYRFSLARNAQQMERLVLEASHFLSKLPWIEAVGITGSLAVQQYRPGDDIDFCIVTKPGTLWWTRLLVTLYAWISGHRRGWEGELRHNQRKTQRGLWCFNVWFEHSEEVTPWSASLFTAYEFRQIHWLWDKAGVGEWLEKRHPWVGQWLPHWQITHGVEATALPEVSVMIKVVNEVAFGLQKLYMLPHLTSEYVTKVQAFFHPRQTANILLQGWLRRLRRAVIRTHLAHRWQGWSVPHNCLKKCQMAAQVGVPVVLVTGVFDVWHREHEVFLQKARELGGVLVVGVESDARVKLMKGEGRPVFSEEVRRQRIVDKKLAEEVFVLPEQFSDVADYRALLGLIQPTMLAVSSHSKHQEVKRTLMAEIGGRVIVVHTHNPQISSSLVLQQYVK